MERKRHELKVVCIKLQTLTDKWIAMNILNVEIKARATRPEQIEKKLMQMGARFLGVDHQIDTYFQVTSGRLKMREGNIENALIYYHRIETKDLKKSEVLLQKLGTENGGLKTILEKVHGIWKLVDKHRKIFFIENVKFHIDEVMSLGSFLEIEAIDQDGLLGEAKLREQCNYYIEQLDIDPSWFVDQSYSDMV